VLAVVVLYAVTSASSASMVALGCAPMVLLMVLLGVCVERLRWRRGMLMALVHGPVTVDWNLATALSIS
jgi:hypothetical protein